MVLQQKATPTGRPRRQAASTGLVQPSRGSLPMATAQCCSRCAPGRSRSQTSEPAAPKSVLAAPAAGGGRPSSAQPPSEPSRPSPARETSSQVERQPRCGARRSRLAAAPAHWGRHVYRHQSGAVVSRGAPGRPVPSLAAVARETAAAPCAACAGGASKVSSAMSAFEWWRDAFKQLLTFS